MGYYVKLRRNGRICGKLGPFTTKKLAIKQAQPLADDAAPDVTVTVEPESNPNGGAAKRKARRRRNPGKYDEVRGLIAEAKRLHKRGERLLAMETLHHAQSQANHASLTPTQSNRLHQQIEAVGISFDKAKRKRRRNYSPVPGSPRLASATDSLVDWTPMNARTAANMERMGMAPRRANPDPTSVQTPAGVVRVGDTVEGRLNMGGKVKIKVAHIEQYGPRYKVGGSGSWVWADRITRIVSRKKNTRRRNAKRATPPAMDAGQLKLF